MEPYKFFTYCWGICIIAFAIWIIVSALRDYFNGRG